MTENSGPTEEERCTLWVGGFDEEKVDQELLYELFINAGPLSSIRIPKSKNYAFVRFEYEESVPYAVKLFEGVNLFGQRLKLQNKALGLGMSTHYNNHYNNHRQQQMNHHHHQHPVQPQNLWGHSPNNYQMAPQGGGQWQQSQPSTPVSQHHHQGGGGNMVTPPPPFLPLPPPVEGGGNVHHHQGRNGRRDDYHDRSRSRSDHRGGQQNYDQRSRRDQRYQGGRGNWRR